MASIKEKARNLLFDLGNVIIDLDIEGAMDNLERLLSPAADRNLIHKAINDYECGRMSTEIFLNTLIRNSQRNIQALDVIEAWNSMLIGIPGYRLEMLRMLREKVNVYMVSNTNPLHLEWVYGHLSKSHQVDAFEREFFHKAYYSHLVGDRKPDPAIFQHIIEDALLTPSVTLFMDDIQENLDAAEKLGFMTHLVKPGEDIAEFLKSEGYY